jgi:hypothetical protein
VYARSETVIARSVQAAGHPGYPATWAIRLGTWIRTGHDIGGVNLIDSLPDLGDRPLLLLHGTEDSVNLPAESVELIDAEARRLGLDVTLTYCDGAEHAAVVVDCHDQYGGWVSDFLTRVFAPTARVVGDAVSIEIRDGRGESVRSADAEAR